MSYSSVSDEADTGITCLDLLESFVVDKACSVFRYVELPFLQMLAELPGSRYRCQASSTVRRLVGICTRVSVFRYEIIESDARTLLL